MEQAKQWVRLLRVKHYIKNGLIFVPLFFSLAVSAESIRLTFVGFLLFSLAASAIYIFNDIRDVEKDRLHPTKRMRPLAKGTISTDAANKAAVILALISVGGSFQINFWSGILVAIYIVINLLYSIKFKHIPLIDIGVLACGYLIRVFYGAYLTGIIVSGLLYLTVLSAALFLGLGKRRGELAVAADESQMREVLKYYSYDFLDKNMYVQLGLMVLFYSMWCLDMERNPLGGGLLLTTVPVLIFLFLRYSLVMEMSSDGDPVTVLSEDRILQGISGLFVLMVVFILYGIG